jgi:hypothetical protein
MNYYFAVGTAGASFFALGSYTLSIVPQGAPPGPPAPPPPPAPPGSLGTTSNGILIDPHQQHLFQNAENLNPNTVNGLGLGFYDQAGISNPTVGDFYHIHSPNTQNNVPKEMMVMAWQLTANGLAPAVTVYDHNDNVLAGQVIGNSGGFFSLDIPNAAPGQDYVVEVSALNPTGSNATGNYAFGVEFNSNPAVDLTRCVTGTLTAAAPQQLEQLQVNQTCGIAFVLAASGQGNAQVQMTIYDANGNVVFSLVTGAGQQAVSGTAYLSSGTYTICFSAVVNNPNQPLNLSYQLEAGILSDPMGPVLVPNGTPASNSTTTQSSSTTSLGPVVIGTTPISH